MLKAEQPSGSLRQASKAERAGFIAGCTAVFCLSVAATIHCCHSTCCEMEMPCGWTLSLMWTRTDGQSLVASSTNFLFMWLAMMVAMMLPSALPMFLKIRRPLTQSQLPRPATALTLTAAGYFSIWLAVGAGIYVLGTAFAAIAMRWESFSRAVPILSAASLATAGAIQLTPWKMSRLLRCRSPFGCDGMCSECEPGFLLGCKQGAACCVCCTAPLMIQLALGIMNPLVMLAIAAVITAEKLLPRPDIVARFVGVAAIIAAANAMLRVFLIR